MLSDPIRNRSNGVTSPLLCQNQPQHIIQRGYNREPIFAGDEVYLFYLNACRTPPKAKGCYKATVIDSDRYLLPVP